MAFPTTKVTFSTKNSGDTIAEGHINDIQTVVEALEDKVGLDAGASGAASHDYLLTHLPTQTGVGGVTDLGPVQLKAETLCSDVASGIPIVVTSTTACTNLNADMVDGTHLAGLQTVLTNSAGLAAAVNDETGTGVVVFNNAPTLIAPVLGEATATKINGLTIDTTTGTLDITNAKTLTVTGDATISATPYTPGGTDVAVADGGTGSGTAAGARSNLGAAASGANSDITSLSGLSTPLSTAQGGTGSTANANAAGGVVVPTGAVNAANGAVVLDASAKLPAVDGSQLTGLSAVTQVNNTDSGTSFNNDSEVTFLTVAKTCTSGKTIFLCASGYWKPTNSATTCTMRLKNGTTTSHTVISYMDTAGQEAAWSTCAIVTGLSGSVTFSVTARGDKNTNTAYGNLVVLEF